MSWCLPRYFTPSSKDASAPATSVNLPLSQTMGKRSSMQLNGQCLLLVVLLCSNARGCVRRHGGGSETDEWCPAGKPRAGIVAAASVLAHHASRAEGSR